MEFRNRILITAFHLIWLITRPRLPPADLLQVDPTGNQISKRHFSQVEQAVCPESGGILKGGINCALDGSLMSVLTLSSWQLLLNISISNGYVDVIIKIYVNASDGR